MTQNLPAPEPTPPPHHQVTVEAIAWANILEFVHLFKAFRLAINPAKIALAVLAILALFAAGWLFDAAWGPRVLPKEIELYQALKPAQYQRIHAEGLQDRAGEIANLLARAGSALSYTETDELSKSPRASYRTLVRLYRARFFSDITHARERRAAQEAGAVPDIQLPGRTVTPAEIERDARAAAAQRLRDSIRSARQTIGRGVCAAFLDYELSRFDALIENTLTFVRISPVRRAGGDVSDEQAVSGGLVSKDPDRMFRSDTIVGCLANMTITGPAWLFTASGPLSEAPGAGLGSHVWVWALRGAYWLSLLLLAALTLGVVAFVGGTLCRLSALEFADSPHQALADVFSYAGGRFWQFVRTPLLPLAILLVLGMLVAAVSLLGAIPFLGELLIGAGFIFFLAAGFVMMLLVLGICGGFNLLYPTLAAEGTDSFDAMSRAFAYVYTRPWKLLFYTIISLIYGIITFLFVSFAVYLLLALTHTFVGWGVGAFGNLDAWYAGIGKLDALWAMPRVNQLDIPTNYAALSWTEALGAGMINAWVFVLLAGLGGYVISFYFASHTIIYFLLRRACDGQSLTDIYEPADAPTVETPAAPATAPAAPPAHEAAAPLDRSGEAPPASAP